MARKYQARILILGSHAERGIAEELCAGVGAPTVNLAGETTLGQLMGILDECHLFITNDSGPMHVAAAFNVPMVAIFGPTDHTTTSPFTAQWRIVREPVDCSPCLLRQCPTDHRCMTRVTAEMVQDAVRELLGAP